MLSVLLCNDSCSSHVARDSLEFLGSLTRQVSCQFRRNIDLRQKFVLGFGTKEHEHVWFLRSSSCTIDLSSISDFCPVLQIPRSNWCKGFSPVWDSLASKSLFRILVRVWISAQFETICSIIRF